MFLQHPPLGETFTATGAAIFDFGLVTEFAHVLMPRHRGFMSEGLFAKGAFDVHQRIKHGRIWQRGTRGNLKLPQEISRVV